LSNNIGISSLVDPLLTQHAGFDLFLLTKQKYKMKQQQELLHVVSEIVVHFLSVCVNFCMMPCKYKGYSNIGVSSSLG
jgi:hypothetical protein